MNKKFLASYLILTTIFVLLPGGVFGATLQNTNPTGDQSLTLSGNVEVGEVVWVNNVLQVRTRANGTGAVRPMQIKTGANTGIYMDTSGNVGVGTTQTQVKFNVGGSIDLGVVDTSNLFRLSYNTTDGGGLQSFIGGAYAKMSLNPGGGNVGIGTTTPTSALSVVGNISATGNVIAGGTMTANVGAPNVSGGTFGTTAGKGNYTFEAAANTNNVLKVDATNERVGIGTGSPTSKFHVNGSGLTTQSFYVDAGNMSTTQTLFEHTGATTPVPFRLMKSGYSGASGNYGILELTMNDGTVGNGSNLYFEAKDAAGNFTEYAGVGGRIVANTNGTERGQLYFYTMDDGTARSEKMVINPDGNVGIGTTSPSSRLHAYQSTGETQIKIESADNHASLQINAATAAFPYIRFSQGGTGRFEMGKVASNGNFYFNNTVANGESGAAMVISTSGNIGIGTTAPTSYFHGGTNKVLEIFNSGTNTHSQSHLILSSGATANVGSVGSITWTTPNSTSNKGVAYIGGVMTSSSVTNASGALTFATANAATPIERMRIDYTGNVGIGNTAPSEKLEVTGNIKASGNIIAGGTMTANVSAPNVSAGTFGTTAGKGNYTFEAAANTNNVLKVDATNERVGIGNASPREKVDVSGSLRVGVDGELTAYSVSGGSCPGCGTETVALQTTIDNRTVSDGLPYDSATRHSLALQPTYGYVGVGTLSPTYKLDVAGTARFKDGSSSMAFNEYSSGATLWLDGIDGDFSGADYYNISANNSGNLAFGVGGGENMTLKPNGNFGIGTANPGQKLEVSGNIKANHLSQGAIISRPYATWSAGGASTGTIVIKLPGTVANYGMLHMEINVYEYNGYNATTFICGGHNWNSAWYSYGCNTVGTTDKKIRLAVKDNQYAILIGEPTTVWSYGHVVLSKITTGGYYSGVMDLSGTYTITQDSTAESYTWVSPDLNRFNGRNANFTGTVTAAAFSGPITGALGAPYVTPGIFGGTSGKGNYTFQAAANTNPVLAVDATNERVGVGVAAPSGKLHAYSNTSDNYIISDVVSNGTYDPLFAMRVEGQTVWSIGIDASDGNKFKIANGGSWNNMPSGTQLTVQTNGNVGVGTTGPAAKFHTQLDTNNVDIIRASTAAHSIGLGVDSNATYWGASIFQDGTKRFTVESNNGILVGSAYQSVDAPANGAIIEGNVGIGTSTPARKFVVSSGHVGSEIQLHSVGDNGVNNAFLNLWASEPAVTYTGVGISNNIRNYNGTTAFVRENTARGGSYIRLLDGAMRFNVVNSSGVDVNSFALDSSGNATFLNPVAVGSPTATNHATTKSYVDSILGTGGSGTSTASFGTIYVTGTTTLAATAGKVIIGGAGPSLKLDVTGQGQFTDTMSATKYYDYNDTAYYLDAANTGTALYVNGAIQSNNASPTSYIMGNTLIGASTNPGSYKFHVNGTSYFNNQTTVNANLVVGASGSPQNITMWQGNILGINKITAALIDPLYQIGGENYSTFGAAIVGGLYEEYIGRAKLEPIISNSQCSISNQASNTNDSIDSLSHLLKTENCKLQNYAYIIDFNKVERGSDLWVWYNVVDFGEDTVQAIVTPIGENANIYYEIKDKKIIFKAMMNDEFRMTNEGRGIAFSFRLSGKRHDHKEWPTYSKDQTEKPSFILKEK